MSGLPKDEYGLTGDERRVCDLWLSQPGSTVDAIVGQLEGMPGNRGRRIATTLLRNPAVLDYVRMRREEVSQRMMIGREQVLGEMAQIGFASIRDLVDDDGAAIPPELLPHHVSIAVQAIEYDFNLDNERGAALTVKRVKMHDKIAALRLLADHLELAPRHTKGSTTVSADNSLKQVLSALAGRAGVLPDEEGFYERDDDDGHDSKRALTPG